MEPQAGPGPGPVHATLLPLGVPVHPGLELSACAAVEDDERSGGDWFDALPVETGALALVAGDVVGRGPAAVAAASQLRAAVLLAISEDPDPGAALTRVARYAGAVPDVAGASLCVVVVHPGSGTVEYAAAGHPPPAVVTAVGDPASLATTGDGRLGCTETYATLQQRLAHGDVLLLASDGFMLPARGVDLPPPTPDLDSWCAGVVGHVARSPGLQDDAVVVGVRRRVGVQPLRLRFPAVPDAVSVVRHELAAWLGAVGVGAIDTTALLQAVSELAANVVEHAYPPGTDHRQTELRVSASLTDGCVVEVEVHDAGRWRPTRRERDRGRGLYLSRAFVDELRVESGSSGTCARVRHRPFRSTAVLTDRDAQRDRPADRRFRLAVTDTVVEVSGAVDPPAADELRLVLGRVSAAGTRPATVDLDAVTLLCSAAVEVLSAARTGARGAAPLAIVTGAGTTADRVLGWAGIPHDPRSVDVP